MRRITVFVFILLLLFTFIAACSSDSYEAYEDSNEEKLYEQIDELEDYIEELTNQYEGHIEEKNRELDDSWEEYSILSNDYEELNFEYDKLYEMYLNKCEEEIPDDYMHMDEVNEMIEMYEQNIFELKSAINDYKDQLAEWEEYYPEGLPITSYPLFN